MSETANIANALRRMAAQQPEAIALRLPSSAKAKPPVRYRSVSFSALDQRVDRIASGLAQHGLKHGDRVAVMVRPGEDLFALSFALFRMGAVPVLIDPGIGIKALGTCLAEAAPVAFIGIRTAHLARKALGWAKSSLRFTIAVGARGFWAQSSLKGIEASAPASWQGPELDQEDLAAILFTSGSTGVPKGALYRHRNFIAQVRMIGELYGIEPGEVDLPTFPLFALFAPALGMTAVIPPMDFTRPAKVDPRVLLDAIDQFSVTTMFGSPALLNTLSRHTEAEGSHLATLRRVISAGAPVPPKVMKRLLKALPEGAEIVTPYGATESLPVASISAAEVLGETAAMSAQGRGVCVGRVVPGVELFVVPIDDGPLTEITPLPAGQIGELVVGSDAVTDAYFGRVEATRLAKVHRPAGGVYHRMGDLGWIDDRGRVWFCGRKSQRVRTADGDRFTVAVEGVFNTHTEVLRSALVGLGAPGQQEAVLWIEKEPKARCDDATLCAELRTLADSNPQTQCIGEILIHPGFPVDIRHNAKIGREALAQEAARRLG